MTKQLENINRTDTLGKLPYDSVLFLGGGDDTKSVVSFMRYYGLGTRDAQFYGTPQWVESDISSDVAMSGAVFATLPDMPSEFTTIYMDATGTDAPRMAAIGYDTAILAMGATHAGDNIVPYLMNQSGYVGINGIFRLRPNGSNERALQMVRINGDGTTTILKEPATSFVTPIYNTATNYIAPAEPMELVGDGVNPMDYIKIPGRFMGKYGAKTYGTNHNASDTTTENTLPTVTILPANNTEFSITAEDYNPVPLESVSRKYIDSVEISN